MAKAWNSPRVAPFCCVTRISRSPLRGSGTATTADSASGHSSAGQRLDGGERDHLAADLGEALGAALDGDEALLVDGDDVAGVVPAFRRRLEHAGILGRADSRA